MSGKTNYKRTLFACYGALISQAIGVNLCPLFFVIFERSYGVTLEQLGRLVVVNFVTQMAVDALCIRYIDRIGLRRASVWAHALMAVGLGLLAAMPSFMLDPYVGIVLSTVIFSVGCGLIEVGASPIVDRIPGEAKASTMSLLHAFYCWGHVAVVVLTTLFLRLFGGGAWPWIAAAWALLPAANAVLFTQVPIPEGKGESATEPVRKLFTRPLFWLMPLLMICAGATEQGIAQWASLFAEEGLGVDKVVGDLLGPCLFAVCMGIGRTYYGIRGSRLNLSRSLFLCGAGSIVCYLAAGLVRVPLIALLGCALCGLFVSIMWPGTLSLTSSRYPGGGSMFSLLSLGGDIGCSLGPWIVGLAADSLRIGLKTAMLFAVIFPLFLSVSLLATRSRLTQKTETAD